jgi:hypothetical protein
MKIILLAGATGFLGSYLSLCKVVEISSNTFVKNRLHFGVIKYRKGEILEPILDNTKLLQVEWYPKVELSAVF